MPKPPLPDPTGPTWLTPPSAPSEFWGKVAFIRDAWLVDGGNGSAAARSLRRGGWGGAAVKILHDGVVWGPARTAQAASVAAFAMQLRSDLTPVWAWSCLDREATAQHLTAIGRLLRHVTFSGHVIEVLPGADSDRVVETLAGLRELNAGGPIALLALSDTLPALCGRVGATANVVAMPRLASAGQIGLAAASLAAWACPVVPVLDLELRARAMGRGRRRLAASDLLGSSGDFLALAAAGGHPGAGLLGWEAESAGSGESTWQAWSGVAWPGLAAFEPEELSPDACLPVGDSPAAQGATDHNLDPLSRS